MWYDMIQYGMIRCNKIRNNSIQNHMLLYLYNIIPQYNTIRYCIISYPLFVQAIRQNITGLRKGEENKVPYTSAHFNFAICINRKLTNLIHLSAEWYQLTEFLLTVQKLVEYLQLKYYWFKNGILSMRWV